LKEQGGAATRYLAVAALARIDSPDAREALSVAILDKEPAVAFGAVHELKRRAPEGGDRDLHREAPRARQGEGARGRTRREVASTLRDLTGKDIDQTQDWKNWWASNGAGFVPAAPAPGPPARRAAGDVVSRLRENHPSDYQTVERIRKDDNPRRERQAGRGARRSSTPSKIPTP